MIEITNVSKRYRRRQGVVNALDEVDLAVEAGRFVCVRGPSGSGKTTLLLAIGAMLRPSEGTVRVAGQDIYALSSGERNRFRAQNVGFVFQMFHLVPYLSVRDNVMLAAAAGGAAGGSDGGSTTDVSGRATMLLEQLGLSQRVDHRPAELSAGERQRVAVARAMINQPRLILADEPTGNLDPENAQQVGQQLKAFQRQGGTVVVVTHGQTLEDFADTIVQMRDGRIVTRPDGASPEVQPDAQPIEV